MEIVKLEMNELRTMLKERGYEMRVRAPQHITAPHVRTWTPSIFAVRGDEEIQVTTTYALMDATMNEVIARLAEVGIIGL